MVFSRKKYTTQHSMGNREAFDDSCTIYSAAFQKYWLW
jgi:hypothetical protein